MTKQNLLTRTCAACGIEKPLSAFLHLSGKHGTTYGSICATCRGSGAKEKASAPALHEDGSSSTTSSMRIGAKQRVEIERQKEHLIQERQEQQEKESKKREQLSLEKTESTEQKEKTEKSLREKYLETKQKQGFLNYQTQKSPLNPQSIAGQKKERFLINPAIMDEKQQEIEITKLAEAAKQDQQNTTLDLSGSPIFDQQHHVISRDNPIFKKFQTWLGADAPMMKTLSQLYRTSPVEQKKQTPPPPAKQEKLAKDTPHEFIEKTWGPSSRKR